MFFLNGNRILLGSGGGGGGGTSLLSEQIFEDVGGARLLSVTSAPVRDEKVFTGVFLIPIADNFLVKVEGKNLRTKSTQAGERIIIFVPYHLGLSLHQNRTAQITFDDLLVSEMSNIRKGSVKNEKLLGYQVDQNGLQLTNEDFYSKTYTVLERNANNIYANFKVSSLSSTNTTDASVNDSEIKVQISINPIFSNSLKNASALKQSKLLIFRGKINSVYVKEYKMHVGSSPVRNDPEFIGWSIKIYKAMPEPSSAFLKNTIYINDISIELDYSLSYVNCAIVRQKFSAEFFGDIPSRAYDAQLLKVAVPNIYDSITRSYNVDRSTGVKQFNSDGSPKVLVWNGQFKDKKVWSDNPAWCFYDLITNPRYGTGKYIDESFLDKWSLFEIAKYCDQIVKTDDGSLESRFSCNVVINSKEDAYKVLNDMASIFRGLVYYYNNSIVPTQDAVKPVLYSFNNLNVIDGNFIYSNSSKKLRRTVAVVRYNSKDDFFRPALEYVEDVDGIRRNGYKEMDVSAFGCTSRSQARRLGRWILATENMETETASFRAGLEAALLRPGDVIAITDSNRHNQRAGGRLTSMSGSGLLAVTLDGILTLDTTKRYKLMINLPKHNLDPSLGISDLDSTDAAQIRNPHTFSCVITSSDLSTVEGRTKITLSDSARAPGDEFSGSRTKFSSDPRHLIWSVVSDGTDTWNSGSDSYYVPEELYRVLNIKTNKDLTYEVATLEYNPEKFDAVELT